MSITQEPCDLEMDEWFPKENEEFCYYTRIGKQQKENPHDHHSKDFTTLSNSMFPYLLTPFLTAVSFVESGKGFILQGCHSGRAQGLFTRSPYKFYKDPLCEHSSLGADGVDTTGPEE